MKIELKNVKFYPSLSEETNCFTADIFCNDEKIAYCKNEGFGGNTSYYLYDIKHKDKLNELEKYCLKLSNDMNLEYFIDDLFDNWLKQKENKKKLKDFEKGICYAKNENGYYVLKFQINKKNVSISQILKTEKGKIFLHNKVIELQNKGYQILNNNLS